jgi:hypothetical protein
MGGVRSRGMMAESQTYRTLRIGLVTLNAIALIGLTITSLVVFFTEAPSHLFEMYGVALPKDNAPTLSSAVRASSVPSSTGAAASACGGNQRDRACDVGKLTYYTIGSGGMLQDDDPGRPVDAFDSVHILWTSSWFATPLALIMFASSFSQYLDHWAWFLLYTVIALWNVGGIVVQLVIKNVPLYNVYFALVNFIFSSLLVFALREVEQATTDGNNQQPERIFEKPVPSFMRLRSLATLTPAYAAVSTKNSLDSASSHTFAIDKAGKGAANTAGMMEFGAVRDLPLTYLRESYSIISIVVIQLFFLFPAYATILFGKSHPRTSGPQLQATYWLSAFFVSSIVLLQRSQRLGFTNIVSAAFLLLCITTTVGFFHRAIPNLVTEFGVDSDVYKATAATWVSVIVFAVLVLSVALDTYIEALYDIQQRTVGNVKAMRNGMNDLVLTATIAASVVWAISCAEHRLTA